MKTEDLSNWEKVAVVYKGERGASLWRSKADPALGILLDHADLSEYYVHKQRKHVTIQDGRKEIEQVTVGCICDACGRGFYHNYLYWECDIHGIHKVIVLDTCGLLGTYRVRLSQDRIIENPEEGKVTIWTWGIW